MSNDCEHCGQCETCPLGVCIDRETNFCAHGSRVCSECHPGRCMECAEDVARGAA